MSTRPMVFATACAAVLLASGASATDLGALGPTYPIDEPHLLRMIEQRLLEKQRSGELARVEQQARTRATDAIQRPAPLGGLRTTTVARSFHVDPSITVEQNILGPKGELLYAAGTRVNPLDVVTLSSQLLFFDGRDPRQVHQARALMDRSPERVKPILTGGSYLDLMQVWRVPVYYDQLGLLTRRFGIAQVPALVSQDGRRLRVDELEVQP